MRAATDPRRASLLPHLLGLLLGVAALGCDREVIYPPDLTWGEAPLPGYTGEARLAVTNNGDDTLSFLSVDSLTAPRVLGVARVGKSPFELEGPHHVAVSPDGRSLFFNLSNYVTGGGGGPHGAHGTGSVPGYLVKLDTRTNRPMGDVLVDRSPGDVIVSPDGKLAIVSHYDLLRLQSQLLRNEPAEAGYSKVIIVEAETMRVLAQPRVCPTAHGQGLSSDGRRLFVTCSLSDELAVLDIADPAAPRVLAKVPVGPSPGPPGQPRYSPYALSVHPDGTVWISNNTSQDVRVFDPQRMAMDPQRVVPVGGVAMFGEFGPDGKTLYLPTQGTDQLIAIDTGTLGTRALALPREACLSAHALHRLGGQGLAVVCEGDHRQRRGTVLFVDRDAWAVRGHLEVGLFPDGLALLPPR